MLIRLIAVGASALIWTNVPAVADPGDYRYDYRKKHMETRADCDKKLYEAKDRREYRQKAAECDRELAKLDLERRREAEKKWRERDRDDRRHADHWDD